MRTAATRPVCLALLLALLLAGPLRADPYPAHQTLLVNDYADLLPPEDEARVTRMLQELRRDTGIEATLLTIETRANYDPAPSIESFATGLFNHWGIGDATRNDGLLILVARRDREMRIELGAGYGPGYDRVAREVIEDYFVPNFRDDRYARGIEVGTDAALRQIAYPFANGQPAPAPSLHDRINGALNVLIPLGMLATFAAIAFRRRIGDLGQRLRTCPSCGRRGLRRSRQVTRAATPATPGSGTRTTRCPQCGYEDHAPYPIARRASSGSGGSFGGGRSSGGGASGRW
ncbi:TPM domain-containing protein [Actibacterium sp. D379-3]